MLFAQIFTDFAFGLIL